MLCRQHGATAAYTPMLHARLFVDTPKYRAEHFTTCEADRWVPRPLHTSLQQSCGLCHLVMNVASRPQATKGLCCHAHQLLTHHMRTDVD